MGVVCSPTPGNLVDLFIDLKALQVVELGLVTLELGKELVLAALFGMVSLEENDASSSVA